jgi:hypothetical protein
MLACVAAGERILWDRLKARGRSAGLRLQPGAPSFAIALHAGVFMPPSIAIATSTATLTMLLLSCSSSPPAVATRTPPAQPIPIDGTYGGVMQLTRGDATNCGNENPITLQVKNQTFTYRLAQPQAEWKPVIIFTVTIAADGSFDGRAGPDSMSGHVAGGSMQGQVVGDMCGFSFNADRGATW